jgi:hypothetical protein
LAPLLNLLSSRADLCSRRVAEIAVITMDLSSKDFSLNFRGFEHDDPETVQRFTAFCEANFALSPETVRLLQHSPETIVLTHGGSVEELEALAKVLREIGAVVDVSADPSHDIPSLVGGPSTQELHRLFGKRTPGENDDTPNFCPYPPPLGRSLYLLSKSDGFVDRRSLRQRALQNATDHPISSHAPPVKRNRTLLAVSCATLLAGVMALATAGYWIKSKGVSGASPNERAFLGQHRADSLHRDPTKVALGPARTLTAAAVVNGFNVELKVLASQAAVSVSSLVFTPTDSAIPGIGATVRRIVGEPVFLTEASPGTWVGSIILSVSVEENGTTAHVAVPASITVMFDLNQAEGRVAIESGHNTHAESPPKVSKLANNSYAVSGIPFVQMPLS